MIAATLETGERSPDGMLRGERFPADEPRSFDPGVPASDLRRQRQEQLVEQPLGEEVTHQTRPGLEQYQLAFPGAVNRIQHRLRAERSVLGYGLDPSRRRQVTVSQAPHAG